MTNKQIKWRERSSILWRLKGMTIPYNSNVLTPREKELLRAASTLIKTVCRNSVSSSIQLGFNAKPRCVRCGRVLVNNRCNHCNYEQ